MWSVKGRFTTVIEDDETVSWVRQDDGKLVLRIAIVNPSCLFVNMFI